MKSVRQESRSRRIRGIISTNDNEVGMELEYSSRLLPEILINTRIHQMGSREGCEFFWFRRLRLFLLHGRPLQVVITRTSNSR
jgi:hypothetical protein